MRQGRGLGGAIIFFLATASGYAASYDGTYVGTAAALLGNTGSGKGNSCVPVSAPAPLTISGGHAQVKWGDGALTGDVDGNGKLILHSNLAGRFEGQVDAGGSIKGNYQGYCIYSLTWQRR
jgi:hypothetical protein